MSTRFVVACEKLIYQLRHG